MLPHHYPYAVNNFIHLVVCIDFQPVLILISYTQDWLPCILFIFATEYRGFDSRKYVKQSRGWSPDPFKQFATIKIRLFCRIF